MNVLFTKTGSQGNTSVIQSDSGSVIVIDAGISYKKVDKALKYSLHKCIAVFITHAHFD